MAEWFPSIEILELAHYYKVQVTFGSDAHRPEHLMGDWNKVCRTLREIGYRDWAFFRKKKRIMVPIPE
ncbi:hypothetical protein GCM10010916_11660 [Paenibacillus abyssi]|uniref:Histidinol-phosphatase n=1 Tax=Paenibacillus abyssi TaxID=1340531 RepID=A0A917CRF8_9BACL|nr:hypothetical protein GCM10010916_11660 [Paenibacillus abyssi]